MKSPTASAIAVVESLEAGFPAMTDREDQRLAKAIFDLLAEGRPVDLARLAHAVGSPEADVNDALGKPVFEPMVYRDEDGRVVGFGGLAVADLAETPHRLRFDGRELYAWCAEDALFLPVVLGLETQVESRCPTTGEPIRLRVSPDGFDDLEPTGTVMSVLTPDEIVSRAKHGDDVIRNFCHFIHFFTSDWAARQWISDHPDTTEMSIEDGFELGRRWVRHAFGIGAGV